MDELAPPVLAIFIVGIVIGIVLAIAAFRAQKPIPRVVLGITSATAILMVSWLMVMILAPNWINARHRAYKTFYDDLQVGMSREQVIRSMEEHYPAAGPRQRPKIATDTSTELGFLMTPENPGDPNAEGISVVLSDGRVTRKYYSRD